MRTHLPVPPKHLARRAPENAAASARRQCRFRRNHHHHQLRHSLPIRTSLAPAPETPCRRILTRPSALRRVFMHAGVHPPARRRRWPGATPVTLLLGPTGPS